MAGRIGAACILATGLVLVAGSSCGGTETITSTVTVSDGGSVSVEVGDPVSGERVREWKRRWCDTELGMDRSELVSVMGTPTSELPDNLQWAGFEWTFNAKLDLDGEAYNLQWIDAKNPPTAGGDSGELPCSWIRMARK